MALTLVVETGTAADPAANTFQTLATAETYHEGVMETAEWDAAADLLKEKALVQAARVLGTQFVWSGCKVNSSQPLPWPRRAVVYEGEQLPSDTVPRQVIEAQAEIARGLVISGGFQIRPPGAGGADQLASLNLGRGALELEYQPQDPATAADNEKKTVVTPYVVQLLRGLGVFSHGGDRIVKVTR